MAMGWEFQCPLGVSCPATSPNATPPGPARRWNQGTRKTTLVATPRNLRKQTLARRAVVVQMQPVLKLVLGALPETQPPSHSRKIRRTLLSRWLPWLCHSRSNHRRTWEWTDTDTRPRWLSDPTTTHEGGYGQASVQVDNIRCCDLRTWYVLHPQRGRICTDGCGAIDPLAACCRRNGGSPSFKTERKEQLESDPVEAVPAPMVMGGSTVQ